MAEQQQAASGSDRGPAVAVKERPESTLAPVDQLPPFRVLLHNDDVNIVEDVVFSVMELVRVPLQRAVEITMTANNRGVALVCVTHKERAELLQEQFTSKKLTVTIEPAT